MYTIPYSGTNQALRPRFLVIRSLRFTRPHALPAIQTPIATSSSSPGSTPTSSTRAPFHASLDSLTAPGTKSLLAVLDSVDVTSVPPPPPLTAVKSPVRRST